MKAKLVKHESGYILYDEDNNTIGAEPNVLSSDVFSKLSLKNCQAIELGYDLDELFNDVDESIDYHEFDFTSFRLGFQKAIELMGDKKFSASQLLNAMDLVWQWINGEDYGCKTLTEVQDKHIQSLQQTEWDVEIEMEDIFVKNNEQYVDEVGIGNYSTHSKKPKLDSDGCLILKRI